MAFSGMADIDQLSIQGSDGTVRGALNVWSSRNGPPAYNQWQSAYFYLTRSIVQFGLTDPEAMPGESLSDRQTRLRAWYDEDMTEMYGPD